MKSFGIYCIADWLKSTVKSAQRMAAIVENGSLNSYETMFSVLQSKVSNTCQAEQYIEDIFGVAMLDSLCEPIYQYGQLEGCFSNQEDGVENDNMNIIFTLNSPNEKSLSTSSASSKGVSSIYIGGRKFVVWLHETKLRLYTVSEDKEWNVIIRKLDIGIIVMSFSKHFLAQQVIPVFESFCDNIAHR